MSTYTDTTEQARCDAEALALWDEYQAQTVHPDEDEAEALISEREDFDPETEDAAPAGYDEYDAYAEGLAMDAYEAQFYGA